MTRVVRSGRSFRMILNRDNRQSFVSHAFNATIVEIEVSDLYIGRQTISEDRKAVIV